MLEIKFKNVIYIPIYSNFCLESIPWLERDVILDKCMKHILSYLSHRN